MYSNVFFVWYQTATRNAWDIAIMSNGGGFTVDGGTKERTDARSSRSQSINQFAVGGVLLLLQSSASLGWAWLD
jgi:hypothetical protein